MTKSHYIKLTKAFRTMLLTIEDDKIFKDFHTLVLEVMDTMPKKEENRRFNRSFFYDAVYFKGE